MCLTTTNGKRKCEDEQIFRRFRDAAERPVPPPASSPSPSFVFRTALSAAFFFQHEEEEEGGSFHSSHTHP